MKPAEPGPNRLVDDPVIRDRRFPTDAADKADGLREGGSTVGLKADAGW
jgi:hypothetical protein